MLTIRRDGFFDGEGETGMKSKMLIFATVVLLLAGCRYESPFTTDHNIAIDSAVLGLWELKPDGKDDSARDELMMILKYSDTEYLIHYPLGKEGLYFRGYPIKIGDISCVQIQLIGSNDGQPKIDMRELFNAVSYRLIDGDMAIKTLNTDLVNNDIKTIAELRETFLKHKDNQDLFNNPGVFRKKK